METTKGTENRALAWLRYFVRNLGFTRSVKLGSAARSEKGKASYRENRSPQQAEDGRLRSRCGASRRATGSNSAAARERNIDRCCAERGSGQIGRAERLGQVGRSLGVERQYSAVADVKQRDAVHLGIAEMNIAAEYVRGCVDDEITESDRV